MRQLLLFPMFTFDSESKKIQVRLSLMDNSEIATRCDYFSGLGTCRLCGLETEGILQVLELVFHLHEPGSQAIQAVVRVSVAAFERFSEIWRNSPNNKVK